MRDTDSSEYSLYFNKYCRKNEIGDIAEGYTR